MTSPIDRARRRPRLASPSLDPLALAVTDLIGPIYARLALRLSSVSFVKSETLIEALRDFYEGRSRLILAFRHPYGDEPQLLTMALRHGIGSEARKRGRPLPLRPHCLFLHGYEVPLWSGPLVRWLLPRTGAMPIYHVRMDGAGLRRIRASLRDGAHPIALAPEGQSSYRSETVPRLEKGSFQLAFWCAEELEAASRPEKVTILPITVHESHDDRDLPALEEACAVLEAQIGFQPVAQTGTDEAEAVASAAAEAPASDASEASAGKGQASHKRRRALGLRLRALDLALLAAAEAYYGLDRPSSLAPREARRFRLFEEALGRGENMLGIKAEGDSINRVYRLRHEGWNRVFPESDPAQLPPRLRAVADRRAGEAWYAMRHMELVDLGYYLDAAYLEEGLAEGRAPSVGRLSETLHNLYDFAQRLSGDNISGRPRLLPRRLVLGSAEPLEIRSRLPDYHRDRRAALDKAEADLASAWRHSIKEILDEK
ncbi:MAG TPA: hypothetical protein VMV44_08435 [Rectinemataceae bacterium]|nr:hypothetical protein [Rectinemataceae bacterium]